MLEVKNLIKTYGRQEVLRGINFSLRAGETLVIMGPSGSGKSTAIRCLNCLTKPDEGEIIFNGRPLLELTTAELLAVRQQIGFVFQDFKLIDRLTVRENVILPLLKFDLVPDKRRQKADDALERVGLKDKADFYPSDLSGGQQQRVGIARAIVPDPDLVLLDEPTASLDPILVKEVLEEIERITAENQRGVILVTHEVNFGLRVADRVLLLEEGRVVEENSSSQILTNPQSKLGKKYKELLAYY